MAMERLSNMGKNLKRVQASNVSGKPQTKSNKANVKTLKQAKMGAKNKMKAQGSKTQSMGMQYSRGTRPKGK